MLSHLTSSGNFLSKTKSSALEPFKEVGMTALPQLHEKYEKL